MISIDKKWKKWIYNTGVGLLLFSGCLQFLGFIFRSREVRGLGLAYSVAPLPTVFSTINGVEGFDTKHTLYFKNQNGQSDSVALNQNLFTAFRGHYFLKNAYSLFIAYPHILKPEHITDGWNFALCRSNLLQQCNLPETIKIQKSSRSGQGVKKKKIC